MLTALTLSTMVTRANKRKAPYTPPVAPWCDACQKYARLVRGKDVYPHRVDLQALHFWRCDGCGSYVGVHKNSDRYAPLGTLADAATRRARKAAHAVFDPLWRRAMDSRGWGKNKAREAAYQWLAKEMKIQPHKCHISMFTTEQCARVVKICEDCCNTA